jgi:hypothetical protein
MIRGLSGLHFFLTGEVLRENRSAIGVMLYSLGEEPGDDVKFIGANEPMRGIFPGVIDDRFRRFPDAYNLNFRLP